MRENLSRPLEMQALQTLNAEVMPVRGCSEPGSETSEGAKMRILHVISALPIGGAEVMLWRLLSASTSTYSHAVVSLKDEGAVGPKIRDLGIPLYTLGLSLAAPNPFRALSLRSIVRQFRPDLIQGWMYHGSLMASMAGGFSKRRLPVIWGIHQSYSDFDNEKWTTAAVIKLDAFLSSRATRIIYVSQTGRKQHEDLGYNPATGLVVPNGIDCQMFAPDETARRSVRGELGLSRDAILVGLVARYHPMKDHSGFLRAAALVAAERPSVHFLLIGRGTQEAPELRALVQDLQLHPRVFFLGERWDTPRLTAALDISCSASAWGEAFSIALGEAMACAVPCVVTDVGDSSYIVADTGLSVPPRNPQALADAIGRLVAAGEFARRGLGEAARQRILSQFSLPMIVRRYEELYREHISFR